MKRQFVRLALLFVSPLFFYLGVYVILSFFGGYPPSISGLRIDEAGVLYTARKGDGIDRWVPLGLTRIVNGRATIQWKIFRPLIELDRRVWHRDRFD